MGLVNDRRRLVAGVFRSVCCTLALGFPAVASAAWQVLSTSTINLLGTEGTFAAQSINTGATTTPGKNWRTLSNLLLPRINLAFGQHIDHFQNGTAEGTIHAVTGVVTLDLPLRLRDSNNDSQNFVAFLTTERSCGLNSEGAPICIQGTRRNSAGNLRMVAIVNIPSGGQTLGAGGLLFLEILGNLPVGSGDTDADGFPDTSDNCPANSNPSQADGDADQVGDACDNCPRQSNVGQADFDADGLGDACERGVDLADADRSGRADGFDLARLARAFASHVSQDTYDPSVDFDRNGLVDGEDLAILARYFGRNTG